MTLDANGPIVDADGGMTDRTRRWANELSRSLIMSGTGSPEGVVKALPAQEYMDTAGAAGAIKYIKRDADDGLGDKTKGWVLI